jgi:EAL domain-containing protein (putative c-di-GMP-specific phosphodiesterase class I)
MQPSILSLYHDPAPLELTPVQAATRTGVCAPAPFAAHCVGGAGVLHLHVPVGNGRDKVLCYLQNGERAWSESEVGTYSVSIGDADLSTVALDLMEVLSPFEQSSARAIFEPQGRVLALCDYFGIESLLSFACKTLCGWLIDVIENDRLSTVFQPIVYIEDGRGVFAYECLLRCATTDLNEGGTGHTATAGRVIYPKHLLDVARGAGLLFALDLAARRAAIREAARHNLDCKIFINFTPTAISDPIYGLQSTVRLVDELGLKREQIVFEIVESELIHDVAGLRRALDEYRAQGFGVALDDLGSGYSSLNLLAELRPDYVKIDRDLMAGVPEDAYRTLIAQKLLETAHALGIATIAEGVETPEQCAWLQTQAVDFAQGYHFARPACPPPISRHPLQPCTNSNARSNLLQSVAA